MHQDVILTPVQQLTLADIVTNRIREAIVSGQFGPGQYLAESELAAQLGVSRSPVREALHRLEGERLVSSRSNQRCYVWTPTAADVDEIFSLRMMLEALAAEWSIQKLNDDDFAQLDAMVGELACALEAGDYLRVTREDKRFHEFLCARAAHSRLTEWWHQIMGQWETLIYRRNQHFPPYITRAVFKDHQDIVAALRERDLARTVALHREINVRVSDEIKRALAGEGRTHHEQ